MGSIFVRCQQYWHKSVIDTLASYASLVKESQAIEDFIELLPDISSYCATSISRRGAPPNRKRREGRLLRRSTTREEFHKPRSAAWGSWGISEQRRPTFQTIVTSTAQLVQPLSDKGVSIVVSSTSAILLGNYEKRILELGIDGSVHRRGLKKLGSYKIDNNSSGLYQKSRRQNVFVHLS